MPLAVPGTPQYERFFRVAAGIDVDKQDLTRYREFVFDKVRDFVIIAEAVAKANGRDVIQFRDLPITKGLQERIHEFERIDRETEIAPLLNDFAPRPQTDATLADDAERRLAALAGGISIALARTFMIIDPKLQNPARVHWKRAFQLFDLLM
jgi:hypothetical protein